jgi:uncharacterized lipoprotein YajG
MLSILLSILFIFDSTPIKVNVSNNSNIKKIESRDVIFGVKENVEELLIEKGYSLVNDTAEGIDVWVNIDNIYSPQQILNIFGMKWLRKDYVVETSICIGSSCFKGKSIRKTYIFAAFLDVENNEIPLNRKAFSKALEASLKETVKFKKTNKQQYETIF